MKLRRIAVLVVVVSMVAVMFTGCTETPAATSTPQTSAAATGTVAPTPTPTPKPIVTYTMYHARPLQAVTPAQDTVVGKKIAEITRAYVQVEYLVGQDYMNKANLMIAGGQYPDMIDGASETSGTFIDAQACIPLDDLLNKYGDQIKKIFRPKELQLMAMDRGKIYMIPNSRPSIDNMYPTAGYYLNYAVLKANNFPKVTKLSQYATLIKDYLAANPQWNGTDNLGWALATDGGRASALQYGGARFLMGYPNDGVTAVNQDTLEAKLVQNQPELKDFCLFMNDLWRNGAMDKETFMQKDDQLLAKISAGRYLGIYDQRWAVVNAFNAMEQSGVANERALVAFPVTVDTATRDYYRGPYALNPVGISISVSCKDPEGVMQYLNAFASDEVGKLIKWGVEGTDYTLDANGKFTRTEEQWKNSFNTDYQGSEGYVTQLDFLGPERESTDDKTYGYFEDGQIVNTALLPEYAQLKYKDYEKQILKDYNIKFLTDLMAPAYAGKYMPGYTVIQTALKADSPERLAANWVNETATEYHAKLAQAKSDEEFEKIWTEYRAKLSEKSADIASFEKAVTDKIKDSTKYYGE